MQKALPAIGSAPRRSSHELLILKYISAHGSITQREYEAITDRGRSIRIRDLKNLAASGLIEKRGAGRSVYYVRADENAD